MSQAPATASPLAPLPAAPRYMPFDPIPHRLTMGLQALAWPDWIEPCDRLAENLRERAQLLDQQRDAVFFALKEAAAACVEFRDLLADHLPRHHPMIWRRDGPRLTNLYLGTSDLIADAHRDPLETAGRWVQEDVLILQDRGDSADYRLTAACVCFPTRWRLADKIGLPMRAIHDPVPHYDARLARPIDRFLAKLIAEKPVWRVNWSLNDSPALFQPSGHGRGERNKAITAATAGTAVYLRVERQSLLRLPQSRAVAFTIRVHCRPLAAALNADGQQRLAAAIRAMGPDHFRYQSLPAVADAVLGWLDAQGNGR